MKVRATMRGYYGGEVRDPGAVFEIDDAEGSKKDKTARPDGMPLAFSAAWMEDAANAAPEPEVEEDETDDGDLAYEDDDGEVYEDEPEEVQS